MEGGCGCKGGCDACGGMRQSSSFQRTGGCDKKENPEMMGKIISASIIILMLLILWFLVLRPTEKYIGTGLASTEIYTSGATLRRLGQIFTSTNQGVQTTIYNADADPTGSANKGDVAMRVIIHPMGSS